MPLSPNKIKWMKEHQLNCAACHLLNDADAEDHLLLVLHGYLAAKKDVAAAVKELRERIISRKIDCPTSMADKYVAFATADIMAMVDSVFGSLSGCEKAYDGTVHSERNRSPTSQPSQVPPPKTKRNNKR